jgi:hypothetical protein
VPRRIPSSRPPKIAPPRPAGALQRRHLARRLDRSAGGHTTWVSGPPGSGKTTLVAAWALARRVPCAWLQVDAGDGDPATFLHYLTLSLRRLAPRARLPAFAPEYLAAPGPFARRLFRAAAAAARRPFVLVLDDCHELPPGSPSWEVLREGLPELAPGRAVLVARGEPPPALARLRLGGAVDVVAGEALRLTQAEARALARLRGARLPRAAVDRIHAAADGWAAGTVLLLSSAAEGGDRAAPGAPRLLFDYLLGEVLDRAGADARRLLVETAFLPRIPADVAAAVTGVPRAGALLADLAARGLLVVDRGGGVFQLHALLRDLLLHLADAELSAARRAELRREAGRLLAARGEVEDAAVLLRDAGDWAALEALVAVSGPAAAEEGRFAAVASWVEGVPESEAAARPWLLLWRGAAHTVSAPPAARADFERAYQAFLERDDPSGAHAAWAAIADTFFFEWSDLAPLDRWLGELERLRARWPEPPPPLADRFAASVLTALVHRRPDHPDLRHWLEHATRIALSGAHTPAARQAALAVGQHCIWTIDVPRARALLAALRSSRPPPGIALLASRVMEAYLPLLLEDVAAARAAAREGLATGRELGLPLLDAWFHAALAFADVHEGRAQEAAAHVERMAAATDPRLRLHWAFCVHLRAIVALQGGDVTAALAHAEHGVEAAAAAGMPYSIGTMHATLASARLRAGDVDGALAAVAVAEPIGRSWGCRIIAQGCAIVRAEVALRAGDAPAARAALEPVLSVVREHGGVLNGQLPAADLARICALAIAHGVEPHAFRALAARRRLAPPPEARGLEGWPWPLRVRVAEEISIERGGEPVPSGRKVQRKPLELLRALVDAGGPLSREAAEAALWPDAEGDAAHRALDTTLHRLRRLLGRDDAVGLRDGALRLDPVVVWVERPARARG